MDTAGYSPPPQEDAAQDDEDETDPNDQHEDETTRNALLDQLRQMDDSTQSHTADQQQQSQSQNGTNGTADGQPTRTPRKRADYSREQKLAAIHYATTTYKTKPDGTRSLISGPEAARNLNMTWDVLRQWIRDVARIESMAPGSHRLRMKGKSTPMTQNNGIVKPSPWKRPVAPFNQTSGEEHRSLASYITAGTNGQYPSPQRPPAYDTGHSLVNYETISGFYRGGMQTVQTVNSAVDQQSTSTQSDLKFSTLISSNVQNATCHNTKALNTHIHNWSTVQHCTVFGATIFGESDVKFCIVENSSIEKSHVVHAVVRQCKILNSFIEGGEHVGKTYINQRITPEAHRPPAPLQSQARPSQGGGHGESEDSPEVID